MTVSGIIKDIMLPRKETPEKMYRWRPGSPGVREGSTRDNWGARIAPSLFFQKFSFV